MKRKFRKIQRHAEEKFNYFSFQIFRSAISPFSRFFRRVCEFSRIRQTIGLLVVVLVSLSAILPISLAAAQTAVDKNFTQLKLENEIIQTKKSFRLPIETYTVTQGYRFFHPGVDFAGTKGSPVYPVAEGVVIQVGHGRFAYGNHVMIDHGSGLKSLYAHLAKTEVKTGEKVTQDSIVGLLGSTGWSTGPHLHFQVWQEGKLVNPRTFFESYFGQKLASAR